MCARLRQIYEDRQQLYEYKSRRAPRLPSSSHSSFRSVLFPDPGARDVLARASGRLSFQAGEFSATYGGLGGPFEGAFDAVVTSFFVDTAPNVVQVRAAGRDRTGTPRETGLISVVVLHVCFCRFVANACVGSVNTVVCCPPRKYFYR